MAAIGMALAPVAHADPARGSWSYVAPMHAPRSDAAAATLSDGRVLVVGGVDQDSHPTGTGEVYAPSTNSWMPIAPMPVTLGMPTAASLPGDRALVVGRYLSNGQFLAVGEIYDATANRWTVAPPTNAVIGSPPLGVAPLPGGRVLVAGLNDGATAEVYNSSTNAWSWTTPLGQGDGWGGLAAAALPDGRVFAVSQSGASEVSPQLFDPSSNTWSYGSPSFGYPTVVNGKVQIQVAPSSGPLASLGDGHVIVLGNLESPGQAEIYDSVQNGWTQAASLLDPRSGEAVATLPGGGALVAGGGDGSGTLATVQTFTPPSAYPTVGGVQETQIDGNPVVGDTLAATGGTGEFQYQWQRCLASCVDVSAISALTSGPSLYRVTAADLGARLKVLLTQSDGWTEPSNPTAIVELPAVHFDFASELIPMVAPALSPVTVRRNDAEAPAVVEYRIETDSGGVGPSVLPYDGRLYFAPGQTQVTIPFPTSDHGVAPLQRDYRITLFDPAGFELGTPSRTELRICAAPYLLPYPPTCGDGAPRDPGNPLALPTAPLALHPLQGAKLFTDLTGTAAAHAVASLSATSPAEASLLEKIVDQPDVTRFGRWNGAYPGQAVSTFLDRVQAQEPATVPMLSTYKLVTANLTHPYCGHWADPPATQAAYHEWITNLAEGIGYRPAILFLEMDSLITVGCLSPQGLNIRLNELHDAINVLSNVPHLVTYLDAGAADALSAKRAASLLKRAGIAQIQGFFLNSTHFDWTKKEIAYGERISKLTGGKHFVINTADTGQGPLIPKHRGKRGNEVLCNPPGRGLGPLPTTHTGFKNVDAFAWIMNPGVSGGVCRPGDAAGGTFSIPFALGLVRHADFKVR